MLALKSDLRNLIRWVRADKRGAYRDFYVGTVRQVSAHLLKMGADHREDLEDVLQETYVEAYKAFDSLADDQAALAWLLTIARRQFARHLERKARRPAEGCRGAAGDAQEALEQVADVARVAADVELGDKRLCAEVRALIGRIADPRRRRAVEMFYLEECPLPEVAAATGVGASTLTTWLARFRKEVRASLGGQRDGRPMGRTAAWGPQS